MYPDDKAKEEALEDYANFPEDDYKNYTLDPDDCFSVIREEFYDISVPCKINCPKTVEEFIEYKNKCFNKFSVFNDFMCELEDEDGCVDNLSAKIFDLK